MTSDVLLVGCGDLGAAVGLRLADRGHDVLALRRNATLVPPPLLGLSVDLTREVPALPDLEARYAVVALTARPRTEESYRATYVDGMRRALDALAATGTAPERAVLVSSTAVHGGHDRPPLDDETTPPRPADGPGRMLLEAEELFLERLPAGTCCGCRACTAAPAPGCSTRSARGGSPTRTAGPTASTARTPPTRSCTC